MATENLFSYGTLQNEAVQQSLYGRRLSGHSDALAGYKAVPIEIKDNTFLAKGEDKFQQTLVQTNNAEDLVRGTVLLLTIEELLKTDDYEPANYVRKAVTLVSGKTAWIYAATDL